MRIIKNILNLLIIEIKELLFEWETVLSPPGVLFFFLRAFLASDGLRVNRNVNPYKK
jgi:hypothetical protein